MKVYIGKYLTYIGPYQIVDALFFWHKKYPKDDAVYNRWDYKLSAKLGDWLADTWVGTLCSWIERKRNRTIKVRIDYYDTWNADHTIALVVHPLLLKLRETTHSSGHIEDEDVPEELRSTNATPLTQEQKDQGELDDNFEKRWDWALNEMIFAFETYTTDVIDDACYDFKTHTFDSEQYMEYRKRVDNGMRLFAKYYGTLWN